MYHRTVTLTNDQRAQLEHLRSHAAKPYLRERAAALLQIAAGAIPHQVARSGLLQERDPDTVYAWLDRFEEEGVPGLSIRPGRGRKPAFSPSARHAGRRYGGAPASGPA